MPLKSHERNHTGQLKCHLSGKYHHLVFIEQDDRMERLENKLFLLLSESAIDREERAMKCHALARDEHTQDAHPGGQSCEQGQTPNEEPNDGGGQDDVIDPSIRDVGHNH